MSNKLINEKWSMSNLNKKAFTLIELLAVIIILGVLLIIAIPSITEYIVHSRKDTYIVTAKQYITGTRTKANSLEFPFTDPNTTYYVHGSCIELEKGGESPFGNWINSYVVVTLSGDSYDYYWTSKDSNGYGVLLTYEGLLTDNHVRAKTEDIRTDVGIGERTNIRVLDSNCDFSTATTKQAVDNIDELGTLYDGSKKNLPVSININPGDPSYHCYGFNSLSKMILSYSNDASCSKDLVIPDKINGVNVESINVNAFASNTFNSVYLGNNLKVIGGRAFEGKSINGNLVIPNSVIEVGSFAFNNLTINGSIKIGSGMTDIGEASFQGVNSTGSLSLGSNMTSINNYAFRYSNFRGDLVIPNSVATIKESAFNGSTFTGKLVLGSGVTTIVQYAFYETTFVGDLVIPGNVKLIANSAFRSAKFSTKKLILNEGVQKIEQHAFINGNMAGEVVLPDSIIIIGAEAFRDNAFTKVSVLSSLSLPANAFANNSEVLIVTR